MKRHRRRAITGFRHVVKVRHHQLTVDEPHDQRRRRRRPEPAGAARREPASLHGHDDGDVRPAQGLGRSATSRSRATTRRPSAAARRGSTSSCASPTPHRRAGRAPEGHRGEVPGAPHARRRGHVRRACRAHQARALTLAATRLRARPARPRRGRRRSTSTAAPRRPCSSRCTSHDGALHAVFTRRRDDLRSHAGEISFPGGRRDDDEDDLRADRAARGRGGDRPAARRRRARRRAAARRRRSRRTTPSIRSSA